MEQQQSEQFHNFSSITTTSAGGGETSASWPPAANTPADPRYTAAKHCTGKLRSQWSSWYFVSPQNKVIMPLLATAETATLHLTISINAPARRPPYITRQHDGDGSSPLQIFSVMYKYFRRWSDFSFTEFSCFSWLGWWVFRNCYWLNGKIIVVLLKITAGPHGPAKIIEEVEWLRAGMDSRLELERKRVLTGTFDNSQCAAATRNWPPRWQPLPRDGDIMRTGETGASSGVAHAHTALLHWQQSKWLRLLKVNYIVHCWTVLVDIFSGL